MNISVETDGRTTVKVEGRFDANECESFATRIDELRSAGSTDFAVDLSGVGFIDSSALAQLVSMSRWGDTNHHEFEIENPSDPVSVILELTGLDQALKIRTETTVSGS